MLFDALVLPVAIVALFSIPAFEVLRRVRRAGREYDAEAREPFSELPLRPPGEWTRLRAEEHWELATGRLFMLCIVTSVCASIGSMTLVQHHWILGGILFAGTVATACHLGPNLLRDLSKYRDCQLGSKGERVTAEELNKLLAEGYRVFHDVPFEDVPKREFNVDHVVIGRNGVFAIETKARRKPQGGDLKHPEHEVKWDGTRMVWPTGNFESEWPKEAKMHAEALGKWLTRELNVTVKCEPILALPGWKIEKENATNDKYLIQSTRGLAKWIADSRRPELPDAVIRDVARLIQEKCRVRPVAAKR